MRVWGIAVLCGSGVRELSPRNEGELASETHNFKLLSSREPSDEHAKLWH